MPVYMNKAFNSTFRRLLQRVRSISEGAQSYLLVQNTQRKMYVLNAFDVHDNFCCPD